MKSVLLVEPQRIVRTALRSLISSFPDYEVVAECESAEDALQFYDKSSSKILAPELIVLDVELPGKSGIELLFELGRIRANARSIILSKRDDESTIYLGLNAGALAFVSKNSSIEELFSALNSAAKSERFLPPSLELHENSNGLGKHVQHHYIPASDPLEPLSRREREVFHLLAQGMQNTTIAKSLFISPRTVETHRARIVRKLNLKSNGELIRYSIKHGLSVV